MFGYIYLQYNVDPTKHIRHDNPNPTQIFEFKFEVFWYGLYIGRPA